MLLEKYTSLRSSPLIVGKRMRRMMRRQEIVRLPRISFHFHLQGWEVQPFHLHEGPLQPCEEFLSI